MQLRRVVVVVAGFRKTPVEPMFRSQWRQFTIGAKQCRPLVQFFVFTYWIVFLITSFFASMLMGSFVEIRLIRRDGWHGIRSLRCHGTRERYALFWQSHWCDLTPIQRCLYWTGIIALLLTVFIIAPLMTLFGRR
jgi:hypothetical protein